MKFVHENYYNKKGDEIPSVTTVMKIMNKPELLKWSNFVGLTLHKNIDEILDTSSTIGSLTHYIIERHNKRKIINFKILDDYKPSIQRAVDKTIKGFQLYLKEYKPKSIHSELRVQNDLFGGTIDNICKIDKKIYIVDYKTSKDVYPSMFIQLAAYNKLLREEKGLKIDKVAILLLEKKKINFKFVQMDIENLEKYYEPIFYLLLKLYYLWKENLEKDWNKKLEL